MSRPLRLREIQIQNGERRATPYLMNDGGNLYLRIMPGEHRDKRSGKDWWFRYQIRSAHDLRRTGSTIMARKENRIDDDVRELCLDHGPKNPLDRSYKQNKFEAEMRAAWERLGEVLIAPQRTASA